MRAVKRAKAKATQTAMRYGERALSGLMRESWDTKQFWFNYAARKPLDVDYLFYTHLNVDGANFKSLNHKERTGLEPFVQMKIEQVAEYKQQHAMYF